MSRRTGFSLPIALLLLGFYAIPASGWGPLYVTGPSAAQPGQPFRWSATPLYYTTDQGSLGSQTNSQANSMVASAFQTWQSVAASLNIQKTSQSLSYNVNAANIFNFLDDIGDCSKTNQPVNSILYDEDGTLVTALGYDSDSILGLSGIACADLNAGIYTRGYAILNGRVIDQSLTGNTISLEEFKAILIHEFGHLLGLDHSQINLNCLTESSCTTEEMSGVPTMFPYLLDLAQATLKTDDQAAISVLYPSAIFSASKGRIQGRVLFSDRKTPAQGYNVIARQVGNPKVVAVSAVSGYLFTPIAGNPYDPNVQDYAVEFGSKNVDLIGYYDIPGLPPGNYTVEVEAINNEADTAFLGGNSVGPIGAFLDFQYKMPGTCSLQYLNYPSSSTDSCSAKSTVTVGGGSIINANTDIILLGTQPRYDPWEDGP